MPTKAVAMAGDFAITPSIIDFNAGRVLAGRTGTTARSTINVRVRMECGIDEDYTRWVGRYLLFALLGTCIMRAQYEVPRKANEYPAHDRWQQFEIGAEYLVHSIPTDSGSIFARDYLVVEVAIYPDKPVIILSANFTLRVNGKRSMLYPEAPGFVAASLKYPDWEERPTLIGTAGVGDGSVIVGAPAPVGRFPGDRTGGRPIGLPRKEPENTDAAGQPRQSTSIEDLVAGAALPEGEARTPRKGSLYFAFEGKLKSIHTLELVYDDNHGNRGLLKVLPPASP
jgi:hypothetical protein